jgi:hypothetical protein
MQFPDEVLIFTAMTEEDTIDRARHVSPMLPQSFTRVRDECNCACHAARLFAHLRKPCWLLRELNKIAQRVPL